MFKTPLRTFIDGGGRPGGTKKPRLDLSQQAGPSGGIYGVDQLGSLARTQPHLLVESHCKDEDELNKLESLQLTLSTPFLC